MCLVIQKAITIVQSLICIHLSYIYVPSIDVLPSLSNLRSSTRKGRGSCAFLACIDVTLATTMGVQISLSITGQLILHPASAPENLLRNLSDVCRIKAPESSTSYRSFFACKLALDCVEIVAVKKGKKRIQPKKDVGRIRGIHDQ